MPPWFVIRCVGNNVIFFGRFYMYVCIYILFNEGKVFSEYNIKIYIYIYVYVNRFSASVLSIYCIYMYV